MPLPLPQLDDHRYDDLVADALAFIPAIYPAWTNHNPSDPGITLVELLAWLTEMVLYRLDEVPASSVVAFLQLLNEEAAGWSAVEQQAIAADQARLDEHIHRAILKVRERYRAVTPGDYEYLALANAWQASVSSATLPRIVRARCFEQRNLAVEGGILVEAPAHVSLVVISDERQEWPAASPDVCAALWQFFDARRLLATRHHIAGPAYVPISIQATLVLRADARPERALLSASDALATLFHPLRGGADGDGWEFGRHMYVSDVYALLQELPLVDYVIEVSMFASDGTARTILEQGNSIGVALYDHELPQIETSTVQARDIRNIVYQLRNGRAVALATNGAER
jgi:hypothetical protein